MAFVLQSATVVYLIDFPMFQSSLHSRNKSYLVIGPFNLYLILFASILLRIFASVLIRAIRATVFILYSVFDFGIKVMLPHKMTKEVLPSF